MRIRDFPNEARKIWQHGNIDSGRFVTSQLKITNANTSEIRFLEGHEYGAHKKYQKIYLKEYGPLCHSDDFQPFSCN